VRFIVLFLPFLVSCDDGILTYTYIFVKKPFQYKHIMLYLIVTIFLNILQ